MHKIFLAFLLLACLSFLIVTPTSRTSRVKLALEIDVSTMHDAVPTSTTSKEFSHDDLYNHWIQVFTWDRQYHPPFVSFNFNHFDAVVHALSGAV